jgi:cob(I)alamin adenosyltransferase
MKIYTKTGDSGETGLFGGPRINKDHPRIEAYGTVDELNSALGMARAAQLPAEIDAVVARIQNELFTVGAELATPAQSASRRSDVPHIGAVNIEALEKAIDQFEAALTPLKQFILPAGTPAAAALHYARTICRRAERCVVALAKTPGESVSDQIIVYLNRLGDLLFVLARSVNKQAGESDVPWTKPDTH